MGSVREELPAQGGLSGLARAGDRDHREGAAEREGVRGYLAEDGHESSAGS
jgi:hypothetical protein